MDEQEEIDGAIRALLYDDDNDETVRLCVEDGDWGPQTGGGEEPRAGPSNEQRGLQYSIIKKSERSYAKNAAVDRTYKVKISEQHEGQRLNDIVETYIVCLTTCWKELGAIWLETTSDVSSYTMTAPGSDRSTPTALGQPGRGHGDGGHRKSTK